MSTSAKWRQATSTVAIGVLVAILVGCAPAADQPPTTSGGGETTVAPDTTASAPTQVTTSTLLATTTLPSRSTTASSAPDTTEMPVGDLTGWETTSINVGERELVVAIADDARERSQGLRGVDDVGDLDGMLFVFENPRETTFIMEDTIMAIDIGFYDEDGELVRTYQMVPCTEGEGECEVYPSGSAVAHALEVPAGTFSFPDDARLTVP